MHYNADGSSYEAVICSPDDDIDQISNPFEYYDDGGFKKNYIMIKMLLDGSAIIDMICITIIKD